MAPSADTSGMTEWERRRAENAKANEALLRDISKTSSKIFAPVHDVAQKKKRTSTPRKKAEPVKREYAMPTRRSARVAGMDADSELLKRKAEVEAEAVAEQARTKKLRVSGDLSLGDIKLEGKAWTGSLDGLSSLRLGARPGVRTFTEEDVEETTDASLKKLRKEMNGLKLYETFEVKDLKMTKERIYAMAFHPTEDKAIVFAGDKEGGLGIFDASQEAPVKEEDEDELAEPAAPVILGFKPHARTISSIVFASGDYNSVYTSSYDSSIRKLDIAAQKSVEIYAPADISIDLAISCIDIPTGDSNLVLFSTLEGTVGSYDMRTKPSEADFWYLHDGHKIGGFSINPVNTYLFATASLDRTLKIWDTRKISGKGENRHPAMIGEDSSKLSVSHASWSSGGQIATTSYDDTIKIYDLADAKSWKPGHSIAEETMKPAHIVRHNNQTGRWVTILKPQWQKHPPGGVQKLAIGNMNRFVDIFAANGEQLAQLDGEGITAVPAVAHFHPTMNWVAGGNASGKLCLWQ